MKILRITAQGLPLFKEDLDICFYTQQRVSEDDKDSLYRMKDNYYLLLPVLLLASMRLEKHPC